MKKIFYIFFAMFFWCESANAIAPSDYAHLFKVDLDEELPPIEELRKQFYPKPVFDRKFRYYWAIGPIFDKEFAQTIKSYGTRTKRLKWEGEDELYEMISAMPKSYYEYIGPYLHTVPGIPEKILNMPGIKETKNKFPSRVAPKFQDIENLEMMSPAYYFLLMPELWANDGSPQEYVEVQVLPEPENKYEPEKFDNIAKIAKPEDFMPGAKDKTPIEKKLRTVKPEANSPLTTPDIIAVAATLKDLGDFDSDIFVQARIAETAFLLDSWEKAKGTGPGVPHLKDLVVPCARLVQKLRLAGLDREFKTVIAKHGFDEKEWAYTCDKTIKAYRLLNMTQDELLTLKLYRKNVLADALSGMNYKYGPLIATTMQGTIERFDAPIEDMLEVKKNSALIKKVLKDNKMRIVGQKIFMQ